MSSFNDQMIAEFRENGGQLSRFPGSTMVLLHSVGAKSGEERVTPLASLPDDGGWLIVASAGGQPRNPAWYHNLLAHPDTLIEVGTETVPVTATVVEDPEHPRAWAKLVAYMPGFGGYQERTDRVIPIVRLTPR